MSDRVWPKGVVKVSPDAIRWLDPDTKTKERIRYGLRADGVFIRFKKETYANATQAFTIVTKRHIEAMAETDYFTLIKEQNK